MATITWYPRCFFVDVFLYTHVCSTCLVTCTLCSLVLLVFLPCQLSVLQGHFQATMWSACNFDSVHHSWRIAVLRRTMPLPVGFLSHAVYTCTRLAGSVLSIHSQILHFSAGVHLCNDRHQASGLASTGTAVVAFVIGCPPKLPDCGCSKCLHFRPAHQAHTKSKLCHYQFRRTR